MPDLFDLLGLWVNHDWDEMFELLAEVPIDERMNTLLALADNMRDYDLMCKEQG